MWAWYSAVSPGDAGKILTSSTLSGSGLLQTGGGNVFTAWGGGVLTNTGVYDGSTFLSGAALVVFGGGHTDYGGNEPYALASLDSDTPVYVRIRDKTSPEPTNVNFDGSGNPVSRHTYQTISWVGGTRNWLFSAGAMFRYTDASSHLVGHYANLSTASPNTNNPWNQVASMPGGGGPGNITVWDSVNDVVWFNGIGANQVGYYDPGANTWTDAGFKSPSAGTNAHSAIDTTRGLWFAVWAGSTNVQGYDVSAKSVSSDYYTVNTTGTAPPSGDNKSILWDPVDDRFVVWAGGNTLYFLTPPTTSPGQGGNAWTWSSQTFGGSTVPAAQTNGTFGRFALYRNGSTRAYVLWYDATTDPYFFRPTSAVTPPPTITAQPVNATGTVGGTVNFTATVSSSAGSPTYQWQSAPADLTSRVPGTWSNISGATSSSYTTPTLAASDAGKWFRLVATDTAGSVTSEHVRAFVSGLGVAGKVTAIGGEGEFIGWLRGRRIPPSYRLLRKASEPDAANAAGYSAFTDFVFDVTVASGALQASDATISGSAARTATHPTTGALAAAEATVSGSAVHVTVHTTTGALSAADASLAGSAAHLHAATGALTADASTIAGSAVRFRVHATSGDLLSDAATISGSATLTPFVGGSHATTGSLDAAAATISGVAAHLTLRTTTGALAADAAVIVGSATRTAAPVSHSTSGALAAGDASISGSATGPSTEDLSAIGHGAVDDRTLPDWLSLGPSEELLRDEVRRQNDRNIIAIITALAAAEVL